MLYPIMNETRTLLDLNGIWKFLRAEPGYHHDPSKPLVTKEVMAVPGSYNDQGALDAIRFHIGDVWYEREFILPDSLLAERLVLRFGSVTHEAEVFLNGSLLVSHKGGFTPFEAEISPLLRPGKNRLSLRVCNILDYTTLPVGIYTEQYDEATGRSLLKNTPNFDFFNYAGIHRPVKIYSTPQSYISDLILPFEVEGTAAVIHPRVKTGGAFDEVTLTVLDEAEEIVVAAQAADKDLVIEEFRAWEPMAPYHYTIRAEGWIGGNRTDIYEERLGIRTVEVRSGQFLINGRPFYFKGFGKHEDTPISGRGIHEAANVLDLNLFRWIGANSFRTSHYPYSEEMMRLADDQGIVVIDEVPAVGIFVGFSTMFTNTEPKNTFTATDTAEAHYLALRELVDRDKNLACVVLWSVANEPASFEEGAREYFEPLADFVRDYDPQHRPATIVLIQNSVPSNTLTCDCADVICLNRYYGWYSSMADLEGAEAIFRKELEEWRRLYPDKPILLTEFGADTVAGEHSLSASAFTEEYQVRYYEMSCRVLDDFPQVAGEQVWNFADFETAPSPMRVNGNKKGIFTRTRQPKMAAHFLKQRWTKIPDFGYKKR